MEGGGKRRCGVRAARSLRRHNVDEVNGLVNNSRIRVPKQGQEAAALPVSLCQRTHYVKFDVLLQRAPPDAENRRHAEPETQRLKQQAASHRLPGSEVGPNFLKVQRHGLAAQERGLCSLARDCEVGACGGPDVVGITGIR